MSSISVVPHVEIKIDGVVLSAEIVQTIKAIQVKQILSMPSQCEIQIPEAHQQFLSEVFSKVGSLIQINIENKDKPLFYGQITAVDLVYATPVSALISIRAYDLLHQLRKRQPVRTHVQVNLNQLAEELTQDLEIEVLGGDSTPQIARLFQYNQSDLQLLHEISEQYGQYFFLNENSLQITTLEGIRVNESLILGENLFEVRFSINAETVTTSVSATGWDMQRTVHHTRTAQAPEVAVNSRRIHIDAVDFATDGQRTLVDHNIQNDNQAEIVAQKEMDRHTAQQITLWGVAEGNPFLIPGSSIAVLGVAKALEGEYVLTEVTHTIDSEKGYISEIKTTPPILDNTRQNKNSTIGVVSQVDDPENMARVKVTLPTYNNIETEWLEVLSAGAGSNKGQLILPDIGDHVLLLMINGEPAQSIILGGIYGEKDLPVSVVEEGVVKRYVTKTAGNQQILMDDAEVSIKIATATGHNISLKPEEISITHNNGSFVTLSENNMMIHSETNLDIDAPGRSITFRGKKIDFEEA